jgi:hypothetical protein
MDFARKRKKRTGISRNGGNHGIEGDGSGDF